MIKHCVYFFALFMLSLNTARAQQYLDSESVNAVAGAANHFGFYSSKADRDFSVKQEIAGWANSHCPKDPKCEQSFTSLMQKIYADVDQNLSTAYSYDSYVMEGQDLCFDIFVGGQYTSLDEQFSCDDWIVVGIRNLYNITLSVATVLNTGKPIPLIVEAPPAIQTVQRNGSNTPKASGAVVLCFDSNDKNSQCGSAMVYICNSQDHQASGTVGYKNGDRPESSDHFQVPAHATIGNGAQRLGYESFSQYGGSCSNRSFSIQHVD